ncbi:MAG: ADP-ribosylglycohydrolase family protein [Spirochaetaceae bacterium]|nr:MAG: ADP-ribosylglycohydrolase family protein [Spirochaetaceae bacterium]
MVNYDSKPQDFAIDSQPVESYIPSMDILHDTTMVRSAILGTAVADASGMGLHWIYSQGKIAQIVKAAGGTAEFLEPDPANYQGVPAFFAHPHRHAGDGSNYGEYLYILMRAVGDPALGGGQQGSNGDPALDGGQQGSVGDAGLHGEQGFDRGAYVRAFGEHFGVGGTYVGYADGPMRETIFNMTRLGKELEQRVLGVDTVLDDTQKKAAAHYIARYFFEYDREGLKEQVRTPLKLQEWKAAHLDEVNRIIDIVGDEIGGIGPDDDQMPALSRSAVLAHFYSGRELDQVVEQAVRITNDNDKAVAYSQFFAQLMRGIYESGSPAPGAAPSGKPGAEPGNAPSTLRRLIEENLTRLGTDEQELLSQALAYDALDYRSATKRFGAACHVDMAVPLVIHILLQTASFREANRVNIMASGDNCGRAVMLGAVAGALYGVGGEHGIPEDWITRSTLVERLRATEGGWLLQQ